MATKRVDSGRGRNAGVVKKSQGTANRAFYLIFALVAIGGIGALTYVSTRQAAARGASPIDTTLPPVQSEGYVLGSPSAPVEVIEFGDFECPQCSRFATLTEPDVRSRLVNTGKVRIRYIDYPLPMHGNTWNASRAAACADEQGKFWEMHDALFQTQDQWDTQATGNPDKFFKKLSKQLGFNTDQFDQCVDTKKYQAKIQAHEKIAQERKVGGTPTFLIGGRQEQMGFLTYDQFKRVVEEATPPSVGAAPGAADSAKGKAAPAAKP
jgi:protein-disulfide isomerase